MYELMTLSLVALSSPLLALFGFPLSQDTLGIILEDGGLVVLDVGALLGN